MNFIELQKIFQLVYKSLSFLIIFIITIVVLLSILNLLYIIYKKFEDINKKKANDDITYYHLNTLDWLNYLKVEYSNYNIFGEERGIYLQQLTLNTAIYFIYMIILLMLLNIGFYGILKIILQDKMEGASGIEGSSYFMEKNTQKLLMVSIVFCLIISIFYSIEFKRNIFDPIKNIDEINKDINKKISENIIQNKDILEKALNGSSLTVLKDYLSKEVNQENKNDLIKKTIFTNNIITLFKKNIVDIKNHTIRKRVIEYLYNPDETNDILFGFLKTNSFLLYQSSNDEVINIIGDIEYKSDDKIIMLNDIRTLSEDIETSLKNINKNYNNINDLWYILLMCIICIIFYVFVISILLPIISIQYQDKGTVTIIKETFSLLYNIVKEYIVKFVQFIINSIQKLAII
jgi:hypothetical protein